MSVHFNQRLLGMDLSINKRLFFGFFPHLENTHLLELWAGQWEAKKVLSSGSWCQVTFRRVQARVPFLWI